jgi:hypothetical protein
MKAAEFDFTPGYVADRIAITALPTVLDTIPD